MDEGLQQQAQLDLVENLFQKLRLLIKESDVTQKTILVDALSEFNSLEERNNNGGFWPPIGILKIVRVFIDNIKPVREVDLFTGYVAWLMQLLSGGQQQKIKQTINKQLFDDLMQWLTSAAIQNDSTTCSALAAIRMLCATYPQYVDAKHMECLLHTKHSALFHHLEQVCDLDVMQLDESLLLAMQCIDIMLNSLQDVQMSEEQLDICTKIGDILLRVHYHDNNVNISGKTKALSLANTPHLVTFLLCSLSLLNKIIKLCPRSYAQQHTSEFFGLARAYMQYGIEGAHLPAAPQKVCPSQQSIYDSAEEADAADSNAQARSNGGKMSKARKPRAVAKSAKGRQELSSLKNQRFSTTDTILSEKLMLAVDIKTSDSDASETELGAGNRHIQDRQGRAKIRLYSITLLGLVASAQERRVLYGYWHAIFPSSTTAEMCGDNILHCAQRDPNARCRSAALQVAAQMILGSKGFLSQAEASNSTRHSTAFLPFAVSLGMMCVSIYHALNTILAQECSLPVLTQALKCLAVLVQATPFHRLEAGLASAFTEHVRRLVYHRDCTIQVSALMVMEFLVSINELTPEIVTCCGLPPAKAKLGAAKFAAGDDEVELEDVNEKEFLPDSDDNDTPESGGGAGDSMNSTNAKDHTQRATSSWLLLRVLENLATASDRVVPTSVRIESLQVLSAMTAHFSLLSGHLQKIATALQYALLDALPDVRQYAARCMDVCAYQMGRHLLEVKATAATVADHSSNITYEISTCEYFWAKMLPIIMRHISSDSDGGEGSVPKQLPALKVCLCDALSNIGVVIFERLSHVMQMTLVSFLSGISSDASEETSVRAAAVRAIAVYVQFPTLRQNLVFVENAAEITLRLAADSNPLVRVKAFWSMGNISDALINTTQERISDDLLWRLIEAATEACSDNDKVRCNAVRTLGNLLHLLTEQQLNAERARVLFQKAVCKLIDCIRLSGNAKVKWNSCYAIGNILSNNSLFAASTRHPDLKWQSALYPALCRIIVHHNNFKVRINATAAVTHVAERSHYGVHYEALWTALLTAIEQSYNLDNFYEYNHRDNLQEQLCLAMAHMIHCASNDDLPALKRALIEHLDIVRNTWMRVINRMVPERSAPLLACGILLKKRLKEVTFLSTDQKNAITFLAQTFTTS